MSGGVAGVTLLRKAGWAHAMRRLRLESFLEEFTDGNPVPLILDVLAPGADPQEALEVERSRDHAPRVYQDRDRDEENDDRLEDRLPDVGTKRPAKQARGQAKELVGPRQRDDQAEGRDFKPQQFTSGSLFLCTHRIPL